MEAKTWQDTMLTPLEIYVLIKGKSVDEEKEIIAKAQAEHSFKAGEQFGFIKGIISKVDDVTLLSKDELADLNVKAETYLQTVRQEGIKKIKEEIENHSTLEQLPYRDGRELLRIIPESTRQELWGK